MIPGPRRVLAVNAAATRRAKMPRVDVAAVGGRGEACRRPAHRHVLLLEEGERHVARPRRALAILAMTLRHADRLGADRVAHRPAEATALGKSLVRHGDPPSFIARMKRSEMRETDFNPDFASLHPGYTFYTAAIASISSRKFGLASPRKTHSVLPGGCAPK